MRRVAKGCGLVVGLVLLGGQTAKGGSDRYGDPLPPGAVARLGTARLRPGTANASFTLSPDGKTLATGEPGKVRLWELSTGKEVHSFDLAGAVDVYTIRFSPDGKLFAAIGDQYGPISHPPWDAHDLYVGQVASGKILYRLKEERKGFSSIAFSADGKALAARRGGCLFSMTRPGGVLLWDTATGKELRQFPEALCYALSPDGKSVATGRKDGTIRLWDMGTGREFGMFKGHRNPVKVLAFSPDGKLLASASDPDPDGPSDVEKKGAEKDHTVRLWDMAAGTESCRCEGHQSPVSLVEFSPDGKVLVSEDRDNNLLLWEAATGKRRLHFRGNRDQPYAFAFSPDSRTLVWNRGTAWCMNGTSGGAKSGAAGKGMGGRSAGLSSPPTARPRSPAGNISTSGT
jgi:WD40 repeat protein